MLGTDPTLRRGSLRGRRRASPRWVTGWEEEAFRECRTKGEELGTRSRQLAPEV